MFDDRPVLVNVYKILRFELRKVVSDDNGCFVLAPALEGFEVQDMRGRVSGRRSFVYSKKSKCE